MTGPRTGGRVAEGARLESVYTGNRIVGSNPTLSATSSILRMNSENLHALIQSLRSFRVSVDFTQGLLFMLGGVLLRPHPDNAPERIPQSLQWLVPHDLNAVSE